MLVPHSSVEKIIANQIEYFESFDVLDRPTVFLDLQDINPQLIRYDIGGHVGPFYVRGQFTLLSSGLNIGHYEYIAPHTDHRDVFLAGDGCVCSCRWFEQVPGMPTFTSILVLIDFIKANDLHLNVMKFKSVSIKYEITK